MMLTPLALSAVATVAERSGIAASAFIRMAQALGFSGYGELQRLFIEPLQRATKPSYRERIRQADAMGEFGLSEVLRKIIAQDVKSVSATVDNINADSLREEFAAQIAAAAPKVAAVEPVEVSPDLKVRSTARPVIRFLSLTRLKAWPLPGFTISFSTIE